MKLDERLLLCVSFVRKNVKIADIGTDHAYLPVYLVQSGNNDHAVAADIREKPLENARKNIAENGLTEQIKTVLSDGLDKISSEQADDIIIAGMGGEMIVKIIDSTPWVKSESKHLILQPMTRAEELRKYLCENGFRIEEEKACISCKKTYSVMLCIYDGIIREFDDKYLYIGNLDKSDDKSAKRYISVVNEKLKKKIKGFGKDTSEYERFNKLILMFDEMSSV